MKTFLFALAAFVAASFPVAAQTRTPCTSDNPSTNCYTPYVHPDAVGGGGTASNASDAQATSTANGQTISFPYLYNGSTFDRWRGDATSGAWVNIKNASIPVTGTFWQVTQPVTMAAPPTPATGTGTPTSVSVGTSSAQASAAATRTQRLSIQNVSATANVACSLGGTAALNTGGSFMIGPGQMLNLGDTLYVPGDAVNCIASAASTPVTVWSK